MPEFDRLYSYCIMTNSELARDYVKKLFTEVEQKGKVIKILDRGGIILRVAFENNDHELMKLLLEYYENNIISKSSSESESLKAREMLAETVDKITEDEEISHEMSSTLSTYIDEDVCHEKVDESETSFDYNPSEADRIYAYENLRQDAARIVGAPELPNTIAEALARRDGVNSFQLLEAYLHSHIEDRDTEDAIRCDRLEQDLVSLVALTGITQAYTEALGAEEIS